MDRCESMCDEESPPIIPDDAVEYKMDHKNRGVLYVINHLKSLDKSTRTVENLPKLEDSFKGLGFRRTGKKYQTDHKITTLQDMVATSSFVEDDCVALIVLSTVDTINEEYNYAQTFYANKNKDLQCKAKILFFIYEDQESEDAADSSNRSKLPLQADILICQATVPDVEHAIDEISTIINSFGNKTFSVIDVLNKLVTIEGNVSYTSTLTRRLFIGKKKNIENSKANDPSVMKKVMALNQHCLSLINTIDRLYEDQSLDEIYPHANLTKIRRSIKRNKYTDVKNRKQIIEDLSKIIVH